MSNEIDILLATYNGEKYIDKQLRSLLIQDWEADEKEPEKKIKLIIRDDGSTDDTLKIIEKRLEYYRAKRNNPMEVIILEDKRHTGSPSVSFMKLLSVCKGDYVMFSDQDDMWYRRKTEATYRCMKQLEKKYGKDVPLLVHSDLALMDENDVKIANSFFEYQNMPKEDKLNQLLIQNTVTGCTMMMNRAAVNMLKQAPVSEIVSEMVLMYDHYIAIMVAATGHIAFIDEPLIRYRKHSSNTVGAHSAGSREEYKNRFEMGREKFLRDMDLSYRQAGFILRRYEKQIRAARGEKAVNLLRDYSDLIMAGKIEKLEFFQKHGIYKNGAIKKMVQMIWC